MYMESQQGAGELPGFLACESIMEPTKTPKINCNTKSSKTEEKCFFTEGNSKKHLNL